MLEKMEQVKRIAEAVHEAGGRALVVGGYARDRIMEEVKDPKELKVLVSKDIDLEVYGIEKDKLESLLKDFGEVREVGKQFEVFQVDGIDVSLPRRDKQVGPGHRDLKTEYDPNMTYEEAFRRRDFTMNAIGIDPLTDKIIDLYDGVKDIKAGIIRMVDPETFGDDPLRPLRAAQFAGRFGFTIEPKTLKAARAVDMTGLPAGRIGEEWVKMLTLSPKPSVGLNAAQELGIIKQLHPQLESIVGAQHVVPKLYEQLDRAAELDLEPNNRLNTMLVILTKDMSEPKKFLRGIEMSMERVDRIERLIREHGFGSDDPAEIKKLAARLFPATIEELFRVQDVLGQESDLLERADKLGVAFVPEPRILGGDDLIKLGMKEGKELGRVLEQVYFAQLEGKVSDLKEAKKFAKKLI